MHTNKRPKDTKHNTMTQATDQEMCVAVARSGKLRVSMCTM
jgi:hypothetical protein